MPPHLAGREAERQEFRRLLEQTTILENMVLTGLRGVGKTVLLDTFKPLAIQEGWLWVGTDLSESTSVSEDTLAIRLLTDLAVVTSRLVWATHEPPPFGFAGEARHEQLTLSYPVLRRIYEQTPGLVMDKVKTVLELVWERLQAENRRGVIFAYDEAQNLADQTDREEYPLALLLDVFQSIQRRGVPFMLALTGLPTLFPKLVDSRTFAERMFRVIFVDSLDRAESREAILTPIEKENCPVRFSDESVETICDESGGYPYFVQFICREVYDVFIQQAAAGQQVGVPVTEIIRKLDTDFFAGRWSHVTDRQRELLQAIASLETSDGEFTVQEIVLMSQQLAREKKIGKPFGSTHINQMLTTLIAGGLIYKNRHGKYSLAVPLFDQFILRQMEPEQLALGL